MPARTTGMITQYGHSTIRTYLTIRRHKPKAHNMSKTETCRISGSHSGDYEEYRFLGCDAVFSITVYFATLSVAHTT
jgi:hypothetical protein